METERGRWFLAEFKHRCRIEDTARILAAIERLEKRAAKSEAAQAEVRREAEYAAQRIRELPTLFGRLPSAPTNGLEGRLAALGRIDSLDVEAKLRLFVCSSRLACARASAMGRTN